MGGKATLTASSAAAPLRPGQQLRPSHDVAEFLSGGGAALTSIFVVFPLHKTIFVQQLQGVRFTAAARAVFVRDLPHLYRGVLPPLLQKTASLSVMFGVYGRSRRSLAERNPCASATAQKAAAALFAGSCEAVLAPFERVQTLLQDRRYHARFRHSFHAAAELYLRHGPREFYRGLTAILLRNGPSNVVYFLARDHLRGPEGDAPAPLRDFAGGAGLGAALSVASYPLNVAKTRMQRTIGGEFASLAASLHAVYVERDRSWQRVYRGVFANCLRSMLSWGIITMAYELYRDALLAP